RRADRRLPPGVLDRRRARRRGRRRRGRHAPDTARRSRTQWNHRGRSLTGKTGRTLGPDHAIGTQQPDTSRWARSHLTATDPAIEQAGLLPWLQGPIERRAGVLPEGRPPRAVRSHGTQHHELVPALENVIIRTGGTAIAARDVKDHLSASRP